MCLGAVAASPRPPIDVAVADGCYGRARARPRPLPGCVGAPVRPKIGIALEAVVAPGTDSGKHAHGLAAEAQSVGKPVLLAGKLDQLHAANRVVRKDHAIPHDGFRCIDHEDRTWRLTGARRCGCGHRDHGAGHEGQRDNGERRRQPASAHEVLRGSSAWVGASLPWGPRTRDTTAASRADPRFRQWSRRGRLPSA
jgi:hypothetical protein